MDPITMRGEALLRLLPHRPPMVLVDELRSATSDVQTTALRLSDENIFIENGEFLEGGLIEHVAQSAAVGIGLASTEAGDGTPPVGFIGGISRLSITRLPRTGELLETTITVQHRLENVQLVHGRVNVEEETVAEMELKVFIMPPA